jgi:hypothetical protein
MEHPETGLRMVINISSDALHGSCCLTGGVPPPLNPEQLRYDRHVLSGQAFNWLNRELPKVDLPDEVELELTRYALRQHRR